MIPTESTQGLSVTAVHPVLVSTLGKDSGGGRPLSPGRPAPCYRCCEAPGWPRSSLGGELRRAGRRKRAPDSRPGRGGPGGDAGRGQVAHRPSHPWDRVVPTYLCSKGSGVLCTSWSSGMHKGTPRQFGGQLARRAAPRPRDGWGQAQGEPGMGSCASRPWLRAELPMGAQLPSGFSTWEPRHLDRAQNVRASPPFSRSTASPTGPNGGATPH